LRGYTLLELLLALSLLVALMTIAWSLMGNFQNAGERGWSLVHRTQVVQSLRNWLDQDIPRVSAGGAVLVSRTDPQNTSGFNGDRLGFTTVVPADVDPFPYYEAILRSESEDIESFDFTRREAIQIEYRIEPIALAADAAIVANGTNASVRRGGTDEPEVIQYRLVRRERALPGDEPLFNADATTGDDSRRSDRIEPMLDEPVLDARDLYRQNETRPSFLGAIVNEKQIAGITDANFQYFDGSSWVSQWNAGPGQPLPRAIALCFNFPPLREQRREIGAPIVRQVPEDLLTNAEGVTSEEPVIDTDMVLEMSEDTLTSTSEDQQSLFESPFEYHLVFVLQAPASEVPVE
jgi:prepilin-type N-terminal cleavage/methylation domain-containing protein